MSQKVTNSSSQHALPSPIHSVNTTNCYTVVISHAIHHTPEMVSTQIINWISNFSTPVLPPGIRRTIHRRFPWKRLAAVAGTDTGWVRFGNPISLDYISRQRKYNETKRHLFSCHYLAPRSKSVFKRSVFGFTRDGRFESSDRVWTDMVAFIRFRQMEMTQSERESGIWASGLCATCDEME